jgi:adenylate cyclase
MPPSDTRRLTQLYRVSLSVVALLAIGGQCLVQQQLAHHSTDLQVINAAQQRQTLCQRLLKSALAVTIVQSPDRQQQQITELQTVITEWESSRTAFQATLKTSLPPQAMAEMQPMFARLQPVSEEILNAGKEILAQQSATVPGTPLQRPLQRLTSRIAQDGGGSEGLAGPKLWLAERAFTQEMDGIIHWYSDRATSNVNRLKILEAALLILTLGVLAFEALLVFQPAIGRLQSSLAALASSLKNLKVEQAKSEKLLLNILPAAIADRLKVNPQSIADGFAESTVLFADLVGFTELSGRVSPQELVARLNAIFSRFDALMEQHGLEKIKTIGDAYMVVGGLPAPRRDHARAVALAALDMQQAIAAINQETGENLSMRIGINSGPVVAGVIGIKKFTYDLWGDTVNVASRMESHGAPGQIQVSATTYALLKDEFEFEARGPITIKGKGEMLTYWLRPARPQSPPIGTQHSQPLSPAGRP